MRLGLFHRLTAAFAMLGIFGFLGAAWVLHQDGGIFEADRALIEQQWPARVALAEAKSSLAQISLYSLKLLQPKLGAESRRRIEIDLRNQLKILDLRVRDARPLLNDPERADEIMSRARHLVEMSVDPSENGGFLDPFRRYDLVFTAESDHVEALLNRLANEVTTELRDDATEARALESRSALLVSFGLLLGHAILLMGALTWVRTRITAPLCRLRDAMSRLAQGDIKIDVRDLEQGDEIGDMARAIAVFRRGARRIARLEAENRERELEAQDAQRDLRRQIADEFETRTLDFVTKIARALKDLDRNTKTLVELAEKTDGASRDVAGVSARATRNLGETVRSSAELSAVLDKFTAHFRSASQRALAGRESSRAARESTSQLSDAVDQIHSFTNIIRRIAEQTNLLALNATIEASRSGASSRGFVIVAQGVKELAAKSATHAIEIQKSIDLMRSLATEVSLTTTETDDRMEALADVADEIGGTVAEKNDRFSVLRENLIMAEAEGRSTRDSAQHLLESADRARVVAREMSQAVIGLSTEANRLNDAAVEFIARIRDAA